MLDGKEAMPENGTCPEPDKELAPLSRNQPKVNNNKKTRTGSVTYRISKITCEWSGDLEPASLSLSLFFLTPVNWYTIRQVHSSTEFCRIYSGPED